MLERSRLLTAEELEAAIETLDVCDDDGAIQGPHVVTSPSLKVAPTT